MSVGVGVVSAVNNVIDGNYGDAALDAVGVVADVALAVVPMVPGAVGVARQAAKHGEKVVDAVKGGEKVGDVVDGAGDAKKVVGENKSPSGSQRDTHEKNKNGGAINAETKPNNVESNEYIYGPEHDPKINRDGSTNQNTWTTPDDYSTQEIATDKLDPFKILEGRRPAKIRAGIPVKRGVTPGGEGIIKTPGGARETLIPGGLPSGSTGKWEPLPRKLIDD